MALLSACVPTKAVSNSPMNIPTPTSIPAIATTTPTETPTPEPTKTIAELGYMVKVGEIECNLNQHSDENPDVFIAECPEILYMPLNSTVEIELITPNGELYELVNADDTLANLVITSLQGKFALLEMKNLAGCAIPYKENAGEQIVCGFAFNYDGKEVTVLVEGITIRKGEGSSSKSSNPPSNGCIGCGWEDEGGQE